MHQHSFSRPMTRVPQRSFRIAIHHDYVAGGWTLVSIRFSTRVLLLDEKRDAFLRTLVYLGGYCTIDQAQKLGLGNSARVVAELKSLENARFLRQIARDPVIYQV